MRKQKKKKPTDITNSIVPSGLGFAYRNSLKPKTTNQHEFINTVTENIITFCQGVAGSGKTHIAVGMALKYLLEDKVNKIIITRPVIESGERLGFLPGTAEEKLHPYLLPILDEIGYFIPMSQYGTLKTQHKIEIVPLGLMRGRNFHNTFIVADECQNASYDQLKMLLTRIGNESKMVLTGDVSQSDLQKYLRGGFMQLISALKDIEGIGATELHNEDIIRNPIIGKILSRLESLENEEKKF